MTAKLSDITDAEQRWRTAYDEHQRLDTPATYLAEDKAWDAYARLCDEFGQCLQPGCSTTTTSVAYCPEHRIGLGLDS